MTCSHAFSWASHQLHAFGLSSSWLTKYSVSLVIDHRDYFVFGFKTLN